MESQPAPYDNVTSLIGRRNTAKNDLLADIYRDLVERVGQEEADRLIVEQEVLLAKTRESLKDFYE